LPTIDKKKEFIRCFLNNYQLRKRECVWILNYLMSHDQLLNKVHFVENAKYCPKAIIISTHCASDNVPFRYYVELSMTTDGEKAFYDIRLNRDEEIYIQLNFNGSNTNHQYLGVLEDNPYVSKSEKGVEETKDSLVAIHFLEYCVNKFQFELIKKEIDRTLENGDKGKFKELCELLNGHPVVNKQFETYKRPRMSV
jgi:uncharacterized protein YpiB (UPF0302 family)